MNKKHFAIAAAIAFLGTFFLFSVGGAWADKHNANGVFKVFGAICYIAVAGWIGWKYAKQGGNPNMG